MQGITKNCWSKIALTWYRLTHHHLNKWRKKKYKASEQNWQCRYFLLLIILDICTLIWSMRKRRLQLRLWWIRHWHRPPLNGMPFTFTPLVKICRAFWWTCGMFKRYCHIITQRHTHPASGSICQRRFQQRRGFPVLVYKFSNKVYRKLTYLKTVYY